MYGEGSAAINAQDQTQDQVQAQAQEQIQAIQDAAQAQFAHEPFKPVEPLKIDGFDDFGFIPLQKVCNARDLGGMPTKDGHCIRKARLMRSGDLHNATKEDIKGLVDDHGLAVVFDLRTSVEIKRNPDPVLEMPGVGFIYDSVLPEDEVAVTSFADLPNDVQVIRKFREDALAFMQGLYVKCVMSESGKQAYRKLFQVLLNTEHGAVLWHCTQGKDRTGLGAYLIEYVLGVSKEDREQDYLATNLYMKGWLESLDERLLESDRLRSLGVDIEAFTYATFTHLNAGLQAIMDAYGSLDDYLERGIGITREDRERLKELYLE